MLTPVLLVLVVQLASPLDIQQTVSNAATESAQLRVTNSKAGDVARSFGSFMGSILHSLPRTTALSPIVQQLQYQPAQPAKSLPYPVDLNSQIQTSTTETVSTSQFIQDAVNYVAGIAVISLVPVIISILFVFGFLISLCAMCCGCCKCLKTTVKQPKRVVLVIYCIGFSSFFILGAIMGIGANYQISATLDGTADVADLGTAIALDSLDIANQTIDNVQVIYNAASALNQTVFSVVPSTLQCNNYLKCIDSIFSIVDTVKLTLVGNLTKVSEEASHLLDSANLGQLSSILNLFPNLSVVADTVISLNSGLQQASGQFPSLKNYVYSLNDTIYQAKQFNFTRLSANIDSLNTSKVSLKADNLTTSLLQVDSAINSLPSLTQLAGDLNDPGRTNQSTLLNELIALNNSLYQFPNMSATADTVEHIGSTLNVLKNSTVPSLMLQIQTLNTIIQNINQSQISPILISLNNTFNLNITLNIQSLSTFLQSINGSLLSLQDFLPSIFTMVTSANNTIQSVKFVYIPNIRGGLVYINSSISNLTCVFDILDTIKNINKTIVSFPNTINEFFNTYDTLGRDYAKNITHFRETLVNPAVENLDSIMSSLNNITNLDALNGELSSTNSTLNTLPNINSLFSDINKFFNMSFTKSLSDAISNLNNITQTLNSIPIASLNSSLNSFEPKIADLVQSVSSQASALRNISAQIKNLQDQISPIIIYLQTYSGTWPPASSFSSAASAVTELNSTIANAPSRQEYSQQYNSAMSDLENTVDLSSFKSQISSFQSSVNSQFDSSTVNSLTSSLDSFNITLNSLPDLSSTASTLRSAHSQIYSANVSILSNLNQVDSYTNTFNSVNLNSTLSQLDEFSISTDMRTTVRSSLQIVCDTQSQITVQVIDYFETGQSYINNGRQYVSNFTAFETTYLYYRSQYRSQGQSYVDPPAALFVVFALLPLMIFCFLIAAIIFKIKLVAQCTIFCYFLLVPLYFIMSVPFIAVTTALGDHCPILSDAVISQADVILEESLSNSSMATRTEDLQNAMVYMLTCQGTSIDPINFALSLQGINGSNITTVYGVTLSTDVEKIFQQVNVSYMVHLVETLSLGTQGSSEHLAVSKSLTSDLQSIQDAVETTILSLLEGIRDLVSCSRFSTLYSATLNVPCVYVLGTFGSVALMLSLLGWLMIFAIAFAVYVISIIQADKEAKSTSRKSISMESLEGGHQVLGVESRQSVQVRAMNASRNENIFEGGERESKFDQSEHRPSLLSGTGNVENIPELQRANSSGRRKTGGAAQMSMFAPPPEY